MRRAIIRGAAIAALTLSSLLAACGDDADDSADVATEPDPTQTEAVTATSVPEPSPTPTSTEAPAEPTPEPEPTPTPTAEPTPKPEEEQAENVDLAPELAGLTDWRNTDPLTLEDLRGEPVVLVFWNSI